MAVKVTDRLFDVSDIVAPLEEAEGKKAAQSTMVESGRSVPDNLLYYGDNLVVLRRHVDSESVDLVYLDPPFNSNASYNVLFAERDGTQAASQIKAFEDTWRWDEGAARAVTQQGHRFQQVDQAFVRRRTPRGIDAERAAAGRFRLPAGGVELRAQHLARAVVAGGGVRGQQHRPVPIGAPGEVVACPQDLELPAGGRFHGPVGVQHALAYRRTPDCALRWVYDLDRARAREVAREVGEGEGGRNGQKRRG